MSLSHREQNLSVFIILIVSGINMFSCTSSVIKTRLKSEELF